ncbi:lysosomal alpha-mannosidase-like [Maniola hyperantus]|uniref:lysosomal alpha-mannosidase-like n=1 Tax=Aphantopus hyperantus TaxID=2795564 RepID=UPI003748F17F
MLNQKQVNAILILFIGIKKSELTTKPKIECGYKQCPPTRDGALNVHIIPHSHMDAGWVKTFDEYYYGTKMTISTANVQIIYHSVLSELLHDKRRKFTFSETAYFWRWWKEQRASTRATFRTLVAEGRIQFAGGGWVQADEATADYLQLLDHYTWGLRKLNDTLGPCGKPKAAWQIDTYGHTREHTSLLAQMGFDGLFIGRVDHKEREAMIEEDRMEFMWRGSDVLGKMSDIMSHTLFNLYNAPDGFCFDFLCSDEPIVDDPDSTVYNADKRVNDFISKIERQAKYYDHDNIMVTMGGDFTYQSAAHWFMNIDKLINHVNTHAANMSDINIFYSTPSCYLKAIYLYGRRDKAIYTEKSDHLPYGSDATTYWTGFYTSRPSLKYFVKRAHVFLQVVKQLSVLSRMGDSYELHLLRHAVSLMLHHDAITGTSQQHVANDFIKTISEAIEACSKKVSQFLGILTPTWGGSRRPKNNQQFVVCHQLNMSQCRFAEGQESLLLLVYNPLSVKTYYHVRLPALALHYSIRDFNDEEVEYQLVPLPTAIINLPGRTSTAIQELCFEAENIPPLGFTSYYIAPIRDQLAEGQFVKKSKQNPEAEQELIPYISNEYIKVSVDKTSGFLESIQHVDGARVVVSQNYFYYSQRQQSFQSGAYSFRPDSDRPMPVTEKASYHTIRGSLVKEIRQRFSDWVTQIIRLYRGEEFVEIEWIVGPVPIGTDLGKEVVSIFKTNISNNGVFYTDSNSRQMMKRTCWNESTSQQQKKRLPACFYPVTSRICVQSHNSSVELCVLTDRAQGGTSYNEGEIELMIHRRLLTDDGFGLEESLNEEAFGVGLVVKGKHRIFFGNFRQDVDGQTFSERASQMTRKWTFEPWLFMTPGEKVSRRKWQNVRNKRFSALRVHGLPRHVQVLTLEPWKAGSVLLRLENTLENNHGFQKRESEMLDELSKSSHITVDLRKILQFKIRRLRETTLAANQWLDDARQMDWSTRYVYSGGDDGIFPEDNPDYPDEMKVTKPVDIIESAHYSDEADYTHKKMYRHSDRRVGGESISKIKTTREFENRKKRSANITDNLIDQNETIQYNQDIFKTVDAGQKTKNSDLDINNTVFGHVNRTLKPKMYKNTTQHIRQRIITTKKTPKLNFLTAKMKPSNFFVDLSKSEEFTSLEEDFSSNIKKRSSKKRSNKTRSFKNYETDIYQDDIDDGITKSIYDMYYRNYRSKRRKSFKPHIRSLEEFTERSRKRRRNGRVKKNDDSYETTSRSRHRRKESTVGMPFFITDREDGELRKERGREYDPEDVGPRKETLLKRETEWSQRKRCQRRDYPDDDDDDDDDDEDDEYEEEIEGTQIRRSKRAIMNEEQTEQSSEPEPEHVITLRPTQIRTFVLWLEDKKPYTL